MFKRDGEIYTVGDILMACWTDDAGVNRQIRGRLVQVKTVLKKDLNHEVLITIRCFTKNRKGNSVEMFNFKMDNKVHIEKV